MTKDQFSIGLDFYTSSGKWRCTDVGTRVVVATKLLASGEDRAHFAICPPYVCGEFVFDEYDMGGCSLDPQR